MNRPLVLGVSEGNCIITVTTVDGGKVAECAVTVTEAIATPASFHYKYSVGYPHADDVLMFVVLQSGKYTVEFFGHGDTKDYEANVDREWNNYRSNITTVIVHPGLTSIGDRMFAGLNQLTSVSLPEGLTKIGANAFNGTSALEAITFPETLETVGTGAFLFSKIKHLVLPASVETIEAHAFAYMSSLESVTFEHDEDAVISLPTAGDATGAFYYPNWTPKNLTVDSTTPLVRAYGWDLDTWNVTFAP